MLNYLCLNGSQKNASVRELLALTIYKIKILHEYDESNNESFNISYNCIFTIPLSLPFNNRLR